LSLITHDQSNEQSKIERSTTSKDFHCPCGKSFSHSQSLHRHNKIFTGNLFLGGVAIGDRETIEDVGALT
jgi:hypothetical protein